MFSFAKLITLVAAAATAKIPVASPAANITVVNASDMIVGDTMSKRSADQALAGTVFFCTDAQFSGSCYQYVNIANNSCYPMPDGFENDVSSFGPDSDLTCTLSRFGLCLDFFPSPPIFFPGIFDLAGIGFNDVIASFRCHYL